ncbi:hypothetical protein ACFQ0B_43900 [Nonomuraea thailandensis]
MAVVADQHQVDRAQGVLGGGGTRRLRQVSVRPGVVEGRVADDAQAAEVDDGRGAAQDGDRTFLPGQLGVVIRSAPIAAGG